MSQLVLSEELKILNNSLEQVERDIRKNEEQQHLLIWAGKNWTNVVSNEKFSDSFPFVTSYEELKPKLEQLYEKEKQLRTEKLLILELQASNQRNATTGIV